MFMDNLHAYILVNNAFVKVCQCLLNCLHSSIHVPGMQLTLYSKPEEWRACWLVRTILLHIFDINFMKSSLVC